MPKEFVGCKINWKEGKDVTVEQVGSTWKGAGRGQGQVPGQGDR